MFQVAMKPVLINFMRRLDKTLTKIHKNQRIYVSTDWGSVATLLKGLYGAVWKYPYVIVNMQTFKSLMTTCQYLVIGIIDFRRKPASFNLLFSVS